MVTKWGLKFNAEPGVSYLQKDRFYNAYLLLKLPVGNQKDSGAGFSENEKAGK